MKIKKNSFRPGKKKGNMVIHETLLYQLVEIIWIILQSSKYLVRIGVWTPKRGLSPTYLKPDFGPTLYILSLGRIIPEYSWFFIRIRFCGTLSKWSSSLHTLWGQDDPNDLYHPLALDDPKPTRWGCEPFKVAADANVHGRWHRLFHWVPGFTDFCLPSKHGQKFPPKTWVNKIGSFFCLWLNQGRCPGGRTSVSYDYFIKSKK